MDTHREPTEARAIQTAAQTTENLVAALTFEIEMVRWRQAKSGWTPWAIALVGAGAFGLALDLVRTGQDFLHTAAAIALASLAWEVCRQLVLVAGWNPSRADSPRVFGSRGLFEDSGPELVTQSVRAVVVLLSLLTVGSILVRWQLALIILGIARDVLGPVLVLVVAAFDVPLAFGGRPKVGVHLPGLLRASVVMNTALTLASFFLLTNAVIQNRYMDTGGLKLGFLIAALLVLIEKLAASLRHPPQTDLFAVLRRDLLLGRRSVVEAAAAFDEAVAGTRLQDYLGRQTQDLLEFGHAAQARLADLERQCAQLDALARSKVDGPLSQKVCGARGRTLLQEMKQRDRSLKRYLRRLEWVVAFTDVPPSALELKDRLQGEARRQRASLLSLIERMGQLGNTT